MPAQNHISLNFNELSLSAPVRQALEQAGYTQPTPIQAQAIPQVLSGKDVLGQAQTGTGKTAAFALPILSNLKPTGQPKVLILAPTRELVAQICETIQKYATFIPKVRIAAIYGGQSYTTQLRDLKRGVDIVVGSPGRIKDHLTRKTLDLSGVECIVLDEADEMLRMGFVDDVKWICDHAPKESQMLLFSATMPKEIKRIADQYLKDPFVVKIDSNKTHTAIQQRYWMSTGVHKLDALSRILETENCNGVIVFVRTKAATLEVAQNLNERGFVSQALNGDMSQEDRQNAVGKFQAGKGDVLVATDVAARGLNVERITHVINFDIPFDPETYVHRIGRTGRAGRTGAAFLFVSPRERRLLRNIERVTKQCIEPYTLPSAAELTTLRVQKFKQQVADAMASDNLAFYSKVAQELVQENDVAPEKLLGALVKMAQGKMPLIIEKSHHKAETEFSSGHRRSERYRDKPAQGRESRGRKLFKGFKTYQIGVGRNHGVKPAHILGAIANEAQLNRSQIGNISIFKQHSTVELPNDLSKHTLTTLQKIYVLGNPININLS